VRQFLEQGQCEAGSVLCRSLSHAFSSALRSAPPWVNRSRSPVKQYRTSPPIGGQNATVLYAGAQGTYAGLDQVNLTIPRNLAGAGSVGVVVQVDGRVTNVVTIQIN
jgi:uncharacterized protein (TIGR03437 family)